MTTDQLTQHAPPESPADSVADWLDSMEKVLYESDNAFAVGFCMVGVARVRELLADKLAEVLGVTTLTGDSNVNE